MTSTNRKRHGVILTAAAVASLGALVPVGTRGTYFFTISHLEGLALALFATGPLLALFALRHTGMVSAAGDLQFRTVDHRRPGSCRNPRPSALDESSRTGHVRARGLRPPGWKRDRHHGGSRIHDRTPNRYGRLRGGYSRFSHAKVTCKGPTFRPAQDKTSR